METSPEIRAEKVWFDEERVFVQITDGRIAGMPLKWFPRLFNATPEQRASYELWASGTWIHWEALDEDLGTDSFFSYAGPEKQRTQETPEPISSQ